MKKAGFVGSLSAVACCLFVVSDVGAVTQTIAINFAADEPYTDAGVSIGTEVEGPAGIQGTGVWNNLELNFGIQGDLIDATGTETGASILWESQNTWASAPVDGQGRSETNIDEIVPLNNDRFLMTGYIDSNDFGEFCTPEQSNNPLLADPPDWCGANRVTVGGLPFEGSYDIIMYLNGGVAGRSGRYQLNNDDAVFHHDVAPFNGVYDLSSEERDVGGGEIGTVWTGDVIIFSEVTGDSFTINTRADDLGGTTDGFRSLINGMEITGEVGGLDCDFTGDGNCDIGDINSLTNEVAAGTHSNTAMDLNADGFVDDDDTTEWLSRAANENGLSAPYLPGDTNLDLHVDVADLNNLGVAWRSGSNDWSDGNLTGGGVDAADLNVIALGWQTWHPDSPMPADTASVPEPASFVLAVGALLFLITRRR